MSENLFVFSLPNSRATLKNLYEFVSQKGTAHFGRAAWSTVVEQVPEDFNAWNGTFYVRFYDEENPTVSSCLWVHNLTSEQKRGFQKLERGDIAEINLKQIMQECPHWADFVSIRKTGKAAAPSASPIAINPEPA